MGCSRLAAWILGYVPMNGARGPWGALVDIPCLEGVKGCACSQTCSCTRRRVH